MHVHLKLDKVDQNALKVSGLLLVEPLQLLQCLRREQPRGDRKIPVPIKRGLTRRPRVNKKVKF